MSKHSMPRRFSMRRLVSSENVSLPKMPTFRYGRSRSPSGHSSSFSMRRGT